MSLSRFFERMGEVEPYVQPDDRPESDLEEQRQSPENCEKIEMASR